MAGCAGDDGVFGCVARWVEHGVHAGGNAGDPDVGNFLVEHGKQAVASPPGGELELTVTPVPR
jgi:hypothetical protein